MPAVQIGPYSFTLSEPYSEGHSITEAEARVLNSQRVERLRNAIYKRLQGKGEGLLSAQALLDFELEVMQMDSEFEFTSHATTQRAKHSLQSSILEVALEVARARLIQGGLEHPNEEVVEKSARGLLTDKLIVEEGRRRFEAHQQVTRDALAELIG